MSLESIASLADMDQFELRMPRTNHVGVRLGLVCTLFARDAQSVAVRQALAACADEYLQTSAGQIKAYFDASGTYKTLGYPAGGLSVQQMLIDAGDTQKSFSPFFFGSHNYREAAPYGMAIMAPGGEDVVLRDKPAYITAVLPFSWLADHGGGLQRMMLTWCERLNPIYGYAGIGAVQSLDMIEKKRTRQYLTGLTARHPGLDVVNPAVEANRVLDAAGRVRTKSATWLTALGAELCDALGGQTALAESLDDNFVITGFGQGLLIQAGPTPQLGDTNTRHMPRYYQQLARLLAPVRMVFPGNHALVAGQEGENTTEATNRWLARFD